MNRCLDAGSGYPSTPLTHFQCLALCVSLSLALAATPAAATRSSTNFRIDADTVSAGGTISTSSNFQLAPTAGQSSPVGTAASTNFALLSGFSYQSLQVQVDTDGDGLRDDADNCPLVANTDQTDSDSDGVGNVCDADNDNDGVADISDNCPFNANAIQLDSDNDNTGNACDTDDDNDGLPDIFESANNLDPLNAADASIDTDSDGLTNLQEFEFGTNPNNPDTDNDGVSDGDEVAAGTDPRVNVAAVIQIINSILLSDD